MEVRHNYQHWLLKAGILIGHKKKPFSRNLSFLHCKGREDVKHNFNGHISSGSDIKDGFLSCA